MPSRRSLTLFAAVLVGLAGIPAFPPVATAVTDVDVAELSTDVTVLLGSLYFGDEDAAEDDFSSVREIDLGKIIGTADLGGYHVLGSGEYVPPGGADVLMSFDITVFLTGGPTAEARDVVRWDGLGYSLEFDGSAEGVPSGAVIDAITVEYDGSLVLSFTNSVTLDGASYDDEDLVRFDGTEFSPYFDGSVEGVATSLDLDGAHVFRHSGHLALSFDGSGTLGGVDFDDEDTLEYDGSTWEMLYDGSAEHASLASSDVDAIYLPEPEVWLGSSVCAGALALLARRRRRISGNHGGTE